MDWEGVLNGESHQEQSGSYFKATVSLLGLAASKEFLNTSQGLAAPSLKAIPLYMFSGSLSQLKNFNGGENRRGRNEVMFLNKERKSLLIVKRKH